MFFRSCFNRFWGLKYIAPLFSEYKLTFRIEEPMEICVTNYIRNILQVLDVKHSGKSLMNIKNKNGFKTIRCGTPLSTEVAPSTLTCCDLSERNALIQLSVVPLIPSKLSFESRWCGTLSKAFEKYKIIRSCWIPLSSNMASSCFKDKSCVSQLLLARKPCWQSVNMVFRSRCIKILFVSMCSCTIQHIQVRETGR